MAWFVARPAPVYLVRWEGDPAVTGDPRLPAGYRYAVDDGPGGDGSLVITDPRDRVKRVGLGAWFAGTAVLEHVTLQLGYQEVGSGVLGYVLVSGSP